MARNIIIEERTHYFSCELWIHTPMLLITHHNPHSLIHVVIGGWHISR